MFLFLNWVKSEFSLCCIGADTKQHVTRHKRIIDVFDVRFFQKIKEFVYKKITHSISTGICDTCFMCFTCLGFKENSIRPAIKLDVC